MAQREGYPLEIFVEQDQARDHECSMYVFHGSLGIEHKYICCECSRVVSCLSVIRETTSIGCPEDHIFCRQCIDHQFASNLLKCPTCRADVGPNTINSVKSMDRLIGKLRVRCKLSTNCNEAAEQNDSQKAEADNEVQCDWKGMLSDMDSHIQEQCPLTPVVCDHCKVEKKRFEMEEHEEKCPEKTVLCDLGCS